MMQLIVGAGVFSACIAVHVAVTLLAIRWNQRSNLSGHIVVTMVVTAGMLAGAHVLEVALWAATMVAVDGVALGDGVYYAFTSYTTLGYGDVIGTPDWRLLGPISAMNGILLFGWSSAIIVQVLGNVIPKRTD